ncbi:hypothetical protein BC830DRAFT_1135558 [Chytriomyces sp. MP71]|nr:hypothetical protein BC830DRAFT_1135558 [Chytriomyces sp. MP71]
MAEAELLRHRLAQLGYRESFGNESLSLVRHLVADLVQTTESARKFKAQAEAAAKAQSALGEQIAPLRAALAKVTAENNAVHVDLVAAKDALDAQNRVAEALARKSSAEAQQLRFLAHVSSSRLSDALADIEKERDAMALRLSHIERDSFPSTIKKDANATGRKVFERLQKIDLETGLEPVLNPSAAFNPPEPVVVDALRLAQGRIDHLEKTMMEVSNQNADLQNEIQSVRDQVKNRDQEIMRLGAQLEVSRSQQFSNVQVHGRPLGVERNEGAPLDPIESIHQLPIARQRIEQLEMQIEHLQEHIDSLEKERANVTQEKKEFAQSHTDQRRFLQQDLDDERAKTAGLLAAMTKLERMVEDLHAAKVRIEEASAAHVQTSVPPAPTAVQVLQDEQTGADLSAEINALQRRVMELESMVLEKKARVEFLEEEMNKQRMYSPTIKTATEQRDQEIRISDLTRQIQERDRIKSGLERDVSNLRRQLEFAIKGTERVAELENEYRKLASAKTEVDQQLKSVTKERDDVIPVLSKVESKLADLNETINNVTSERNNISNLYQQSQHEVERLRAGTNGQRTRESSNIAQHPSEAGVQTDSNSPANQSVLIKPDEYSAAKTRVKELEARERDLEDEVIKLQSDLKAIIYKQREAGANTDEAIRQIESERDGFKVDLETKEVIIGALEEKVNLLNEKINFKEHEIQDKDRQLDEMRNGISMMEMNLKDSNVQLKDTRSKLQELTTKRESLESQVAQLSSQLREANSKIAQHRDLLSQVDQDRDAYRTQMDDKTEKLSELERTLSATRLALQKAETDLAQAYAENEKLCAQRDEQDEEMGVLQSHLRGLSGEKDRLAFELNSLQEDFRNMSSDLAAMTKESQVLNAEWTEVARERDHFQSEVAHCESQIHFLDNLVREKEMERDRAMNSYVKVVAEKDRVEMQLRAAEEDTTNLRMEVIMREKRVAQVQRELEDATSDGTNLKIDLGAYEKQASNLTKSLATSERNCRHLETEKQRLLREVGAVRDLAQTFDRNRENLQKEYLAAKLESDRLQKLLDKALVDQDSLVNEVRSEKLKYERLEGLLANERTKHLVINASEKEHIVSQQQSSLATAAREVSSLSEQLHLSQKKVEQLETKERDQSAEISNLRTVLERMTQEMDELKSRPRQILASTPSTPLQPTLSTPRVSSRADYQLNSEQRSPTASKGDSDMGRNQLELEQRKLSTPKGESEVERRIRAELENTKAQLRSYEKQIEERLSRTSTPK